MGIPDRARASFNWTFPPFHSKPVKSLLPYIRRSVVLGNCSICHTQISPRVADYSQKYFGEYLCMDCQKSVRETIDQPRVKTVVKQMITEQVERPQDEGGEFPSHSEFYRDFHIIENYIVEAIFERMGYQYREEKRSLFGGKKIIETEFETDFEVNGWDVVISILDTPEKALQPTEDRGETTNFLFCFEYKSSIEEWGKQFDRFIRQIKARPVPPSAFKFLISFDDRFEDYVQAGLTAGFFIFTIPKDLISELKANR